MRDLRELSPSEQEGSAGQSLRREVSRLQALEAIQTGNAELVQTAKVPSDPSSPKTKRNVVLGGIVGLVLGIGLALLTELFDRKLRSPRDFEAATGGLPVLATIPTMKKTRASANGGRELLISNRESLEMLRAHLRYFNVDREIRSLLVTSATGGEGKSTISLNLAASAVSAGVKTLLVEVDLHRPSLARLIGTDPAPGLSELLSGQPSQIRQLIVHDQQHGEDGENTGPVLHLMLAGSTPPNSAKLLASDEMARLLREWTAKYDLVVIDTPPILHVADAIPLLGQVDGVLVVGQINKTTRDEAVRLANSCAVSMRPSWAW